MGKKLCFVAMLFSLILLTACAQQQTQANHQAPPTHTSMQSSPTVAATATQQPIAQIHQINLPPHAIVPTPTQAPTSNPNVAPANVSVGKGIGAAPYGQPPAMTAEETDLTQKLFALINSDRASRGLYAFTWNATLAGGARLHSWNMYHCGFSHTCPDGVDQCTRIANEGFAGYTDCGENIGYAGPYPTPWQGVYNIQEQMMAEGPTGWHFIHLTSTTLHRIGVGIYVDPTGYIWFTEDMVS